MIKYKLQAIKNPLDMTSDPKYYAVPVIDETLTLKDITAHMADHNAGFSEAVIYGVIKAMVKCIKEMMLAGKNVKIDDLAIFSVGIVNKAGGAESEALFDVKKNVKSVKFRARSTGTLTNSKLDLEATLKKATFVVS